MLISPHRIVPASGSSEYWRKSNVGRAGLVASDDQEATASSVTLVDAGDGFSADALLNRGCTFAFG